VSPPCGRVPHADHEPAMSGLRERWRGRRGAEEGQGKQRDRLLVGSRRPAADAGGLGRRNDQPQRHEDDGAERRGERGEERGAQHERDGENGDRPARARRHDGSV